MSYKFSASHITGGNVVFPDKLEIDDEKVTFYKARLVGYATTVIQRSSIGSARSKRDYSSLTSSSRPMVDK